jgi:hypothetical protein
MGMRRTTLERAGQKRSTVLSIKTAFQLARLVKVPLEDILAGRWPESERCPHCGRL